MTKIMNFKHLLHDLITHTFYLYFDSQRLMQSVEPSKDWGPAAKCYKVMYEDIKEKRRSKPYRQFTIFAQKGL